MAAPAKFLFDTDFGRSHAPSVADRSAAIAEAEARGYRNGVAAGATEVERKLATAMGHAAVSMEAMARSLAAVERRLETEAVEVAVSVARKLAPALMRREPFAEIAALAADCFAHLVGAPHVVVRVNDALYEAARARLEEIAGDNGFSGRLVVLSDPDVEFGDCRIEWADGGLVRDTAASEAAIVEAVERYLAVRREPAASAAASGALNNE
jgi:flagellar assembly protein FliH